MKTKIYILSFITTVIIFLTACPYQSTVPIDEPNIKTDKKIIGKWIKSSDISNENPNFYLIEELNEFKYKIINNEYNSSDSTYTKTVYLTHISKIDDLVFMNMQKDGTGDYYLHRIDIGNNEFTLYEITDNIDEKFNTSKELKEFVKSNMKLSFFYNKDEVKYLREK